MPAAENPRSKLCDVSCVWKRMLGAPAYSILRFQLVGSARQGQPSGHSLWPVMAQHGMVECIGNDWIWLVGGITKVSYIICLKDVGKTNPIGYGRVSAEGDWQFLGVPYARSICFHQIRTIFQSANSTVFQKDAKWSIQAFVQAFLLTVEQPS